MRVITAQAQRAPAAAPDLPFSPHAHASAPFLLISMLVVAVGTPAFDMDASAAEPVKMRFMPDRPSRTCRF
jgi:hypothetical protein